jgi:dihydropteroate synthase
MWTGVVHPQLRGLPPALVGVRRCLVMGVVNVTPDSFSDGGQWFEPNDAIRHGLDLIDEGADLLDVGGESTRPGAQRVDADEELRRVMPVVRALVDAGAVVSIDTMHARVAQTALDAGAHIVNDVSGGLADPDMARTVAAAAVPYIAMHWRGHSDHMAELAHYADVVADVAAELRVRLEALVEHGMDVEQVVLDPGLGFAKTGAHNLELLARLGELVALGRPLMVGASRKRFLGTVLAAADGTPRPPQARDDATVATSTLLALAGAWCVRVHTVRGTADAVRVVAAVQDPSGVRGEVDG